MIHATSLKRVRNEKKGRLRQRKQTLVPPLRRLRRRRGGDGPQLRDVQLLSDQVPHRRAAAQRLFSHHHPAPGENMGRRQ